MRMIRRLVHWWRFRNNQAALEEELAFHREEIEREMIARGQSPEGARRAARRAMGNELYMREEARGVWLWPSLEGVWKDARGTLRGLRRSPAFTAGVLLTFALGVGANVAMFSLIDRLMLRPPPLMRDPATAHRVYMYRTSRGVEGPTGGQYPRNADLARFTTSFSNVAMHSVKLLAVGVGQDARELRVGVVSAEFFSFFDAPPAIGRYFTHAEDTPPVGAPVAVLSYGFWQSRYGASRAVIGTQLQIDAVVYTIIGVAPKPFAGLWPLRPPVAYIPVTAYSAGESDDWVFNYGHAINLSTIVRRKPGVSITQANTDLQQAFIRSYRAEGANATPSAVEERLATIRPRAIAGSILLERGPERSNVAKVTTWLAGVSIIVLFIACANVANLLLARALARRREIALKVALGVSRVRLLSQLMTESMLLAVLGSALGIGVAVWLSAMLSASFLPGTERAPVMSDARTLGFLAIVAVAVGLFTGVLPMLQARRLSLTDDLKFGARAGTYQRSRARVVLLVLQGALSLVLLVGAGLFVRSLNHVRSVRLGFDADSVLVVGTSLRGVVLDTGQMIELRQRLLVAATTVPGIDHASVRGATPFGGMWSYPIFVAGVDSVPRFGRFDFNTVSPDYFVTMGTRLVRGRGVESSDVAGATRVMVIGESMGNVLWPGQDPIGKCVRIRLEINPCTYVVGIAEDIHSESIGPETRLFYYYVPATQTLPEDVALFARVRGDAQDLVEPLRERLQQEMPGTAYVTVSRLAENLEAEMRSWVMGATLFTAFGGLALLLAAIGLYSVIAYNVSQRRQELAVRMALGAAASDVLRMVVGDGLRFALSGVLVGGVIAWYAGRWIAPLLFDQSAHDPVVFGFVTGALLVVAITASAIPAIRGARMDPNDALRRE
jgi:putative ABC transport system permease protein